MAKKQRSQTSSAAYQASVAQAQARKAASDAAAAAAKAKSDMARAEADSRRAEAEARAEEARSRAAVEASKAALESKRLDAAAKTPSSGERAYQVGLNLAGPLAGIGVGTAMAKSLEARHTASRALMNTEIRKLGADARVLMDGAKSKAASARLGAIVKASDMMALTHVRGPLGLIPAGMLLAEGAYSRFILADKVDSEAAKEALRQVGTASAFAATTMLGKRLVQNATPKALPAARDVAAIESARTLTTKTIGTGLAEAATETGAKVLARGAVRALPYVGWGVVAMGAAASGYRAYARGESVPQIAKHAVLGAIGLDVEPASANESHFSAANAAYKGIRARAVTSQSAASRGWANPKVQMAAQAAKGRTFSGFRNA